MTLLAITDIRGISYQVALTSEVRSTFSNCSCFFFVNLSEINSITFNRYCTFCKVLLWWLGKKSYAILFPSLQRRSRLKINFSAKISIKILLIHYNYNWIYVFEYSSLQSFLVYIFYRWNILQSILYIIFAKRS